MNIPDDIYQKKPSDRRSHKRGSSADAGLSAGTGSLLKRKSWQPLWRDWINRRLPAARHIVLNQRSIFIFPTIAGAGFLGLIFLLLLVGINFENSAVYALTFLMLGLFIVSILHTFSNLSGIHLTAAHVDAAFSGRDATFRIVLSKQGARNYYALRLGFPSNASALVNLDDGNEVWVDLRYRTGPRGLCRPGRMKVETRYPLGLLKAWTWIDLDMQALVYPLPDQSSKLPQSAIGDNDTGAKEQVGSDDFYGLRDYRAGDTIKSVAWRNFAKTGQLNTKQFVDQIDQRLWLDWEDTDGNEEQRLSQLCYWVLEAERGHSDYGLKLPGTSIKPARDSAHLHGVLRELALYNLPSDKAGTV